MNDLPSAVPAVRSTPSAILRALPAMLLLTLYLWIGIGLVAAIVVGITQSTLLAAVVGVILAVPGCIGTWRLIGMCVEAERHTP